MFWFGSNASSQAQPIGLGAALNFGLLINNGDLSIGNHCIVSSSIGVLGGDSVLDFDCRVSRDLVDSNDLSEVTLGKSAHVLGKCATTSDAITLEKGATCGSRSTDGSSLQITDLNNAIPDEQAFESAVDELPPTQSILTSIVVQDFQAVTISDTVHGGLNVIHVPAVFLADYSTLYLSGGIKDRLLLVIESQLGLSPNARIIPVGGLLIKNIYISAESLAFSPTNSPGSELNGTVRFASVCALGAGITINGALICD